MKKTCKNCKFLGRETEHLKTDYLREQVINDESLFTCSVKGHEYFTGSWAFGLCNAPFDEPMCGGHYFEPKIKQAELFN